MKTYIIGVSAKKQGGKCLVGDSIVFTKNGLKRISCLTHNSEGVSTIDKVRLFDESGTGFASHGYFKKDCHTYSITTNYGYNIEGSSNHPVRVFSKDCEFIWKKLKDISLDDYLCLCSSGFGYSGNRKIEFKFDKQKHVLKFKDKSESRRQYIARNIKDVSIPKNFTKGFARFCGFFIAEGNNYGNSITVTNSDFNILRDIQKTLHEDFKVYSDIFSYKNKASKISVNRLIFVKFCKSIGICGSSGDKCISDSILNLPKYLLAEFLKAYYEGDGGVDGNSISCTSKSYKLVKDLQTILLSFGITSSLKTNEKYASNTKLKTRRKYYLLRICGKNILKFRNEIGFFSNSKNKQLDILCDFILGRERNGKMHSVPFLKSKINSFIKILPIKKNGNLVVGGKRVAKIRKPQTISQFVDGGINRKGLIDSCNYLKKIICILDKNNQDLIQEAKSILDLIDDVLKKDIVFIKVNKIEKNQKDVYDLCKDGNDHSFISNGFISHNSSLCDFIYNEYNNNDIKIYSFADPLKRFCIDAMGLKEEQCYGSDDDKNTLTEYNWETLPWNIGVKFGKEIDVPIKGTNISSIFKAPRTGPMTGREVLQIFGSDIMRDMFSDKIWVNATISLIKKENPPIALIADARFESEINALMAEENGHVIRLTRKICEDSHPSETALDTFDFSKLGERCLVIDNNDMMESEKNEIVRPFFEKIRDKVVNVRSLMIENL